jgi:hypothetical protein
MENEMGHVHDENCGHDEAAPGEIALDVTLHDDAVVATGALSLIADGSGALLNALETHIARLAASVEDVGGIIGHIKAAVRLSETVAMSCTDVRHGVTSRSAPGTELDITLAAIVFAVERETVAALVRAALETVRDAANENESWKTPE